MLRRTKLVMGTFVILIIGISCIMDPVTSFILDDTEVLTSVEVVKETVFEEEELDSVSYTSSITSAPTISTPSVTIPTTIVEDVNFKLALIPPRRLKAFWDEKNSTLDTLCLYNDDHRHCFSPIESGLEITVPAGVILYASLSAGSPPPAENHFTWFSKTASTLESFNNKNKPKNFSVIGSEMYLKEIYVPWQLLVGDSTSSSIMVEWMPGENVSAICWGVRNSTKDYTLDLNECDDVVENHYIIYGLPSSQEIEISLDVGTKDPLVIYTNTKGSEIYLSHAWHCNPNNLCYDGQLCYPTTDGLLLPETRPSLVDPPTNYRYTCRYPRSLSNKNGKSSRIISNSMEIIFIRHADFSFISEPDLPFCSLPNALALISYWCNGKADFELLYERLHSYFAESEGCQNSNINNFQLDIDYKYLIEWRCLDGFILYKDHLTCYGVPNRNAVDFDSARQECQRLGGDVAYILNDEMFTEFLINDVQIPLEFWSLGILHNSIAVRPQMLYSAQVDKLYVQYTNSAFHADPCYDRCIDIIAATLCSLPILGDEFYRLENLGSIPDNCTSGSCKHGGTCYPVSQSPGLLGNDSSFMCRCRDGYSGLQCETADDNSKEELLTPLNGVYKISSPNDTVISIEYAYFGRNASMDFYGCYSYGTMALLRLKCENQQDCSISHRDLQNQLSSTCHPDIPPELRVRISYHDKISLDLGCENGEFYDRTGTCFYLMDDSFKNAQEAKLGCNSLGGDIAFPRDDLIMCHHSVFSAWVDESRQPHSPDFSMIVIQPNILFCGNSTATDYIQALCEFPPIPVSLPTTSSGKTELTTKTTKIMSTMTTTEITSTSTAVTTPEPIPDCPRVRPFPDLYPNYIWMSAAPCALTSQKCPNGTDVTGSNVTWSCSCLGKWVDLPDMRNCQTLDLGGWVNELNDTSSDATAGDTLERISANLTDNLAPGDIIGLVKLLDFAQERHNWDLRNTSGSEEAALNITKQYTNSVSNISSMILEDPEVWDGIPLNTRFSTGSQLQENVEVAAVEVSLLLKNQTQNFTFNSISIVAQQYSSQYYNDSNHRTFSHPKYGSSRVILPSDFHSELPNTENVAVTFTAYNTLHCILSEGTACSGNNVDPEFIMEGVVNSPVMGLTIGNTSWHAPPGAGRIVATFSHFFFDDIYNLTQGTCVWWDLVNSTWSPDNCVMINSTSLHTACSCNHLTNLAVIVDVNGKLSGVFKDITTYITIIGCSISLVCLVFAILTLVQVVKKLKDTYKANSVIHLNFCCCLFAAEVVLLVGLDRKQWDIGCKVVAGLLHYLLMATFCWMGVESFNAYKLLIKIFGSGKTYMKRYYAFGYGIPLIIVGISVIIAITKGQGYGTQYYCWLDYQNHMTWAFAGPALLILLNNVVIFVLSTRAVKNHSGSDVQAGKRKNTSMGSDRRKDDKIKRADKRKDNKKMIMVSFSLAWIMGITWLIGFIAIFEGMEWMAVVFTFINSLQGVGLFIALILFPAKPRSQFLKMFPCRPKRKGTHLYGIWYPYGKRGEYDELGNTGDSSSLYYQRDSSFRWSERLTSVSNVSRDNVPIIPRAKLSRRSSGFVNPVMKNSGQNRLSTQ